MATKEVDQADSAPASTPPESEASLREKIKAQVEYYFSRQNLLQDAFLVGKMDKDHFVDVSVIAEFKLMKQLTTDLDLIFSSIKDSDKIVFDDTKKRIRPSAINQRTTLILRNIPSDAEPSSVEALLATVKIPKILNLRSDVGNNWFATFETEEATKSALEVVKTLKWGDKSIGVGIKCEKGLGLIASSSAGSSPLPYYMPMNAASSAGYSAQNGVFGGYANSSESGHGHYRHSGKGGPGGRRGPGSGPAGVPAPAEGVEVAKRQSGGKKNKLKGPRDAGVRDGEAGRAAGSSLPAAKEAQASLDLADFPVLEANPLKKTDSSSALDEVSAGGSESQAKTDESDAKRDTPVGSVSPGGNTENGPSEAQPSSASSIFPGKKLSYAQMAQATPTPAAPSTPAVAGTGQAGAQAVSPSVVKAD